MSRHVLTPRNPAHGVAVGWDRLLGTFFAQVINEDGNGRTILWVGGDYGEVPGPELAVEIVARFAVLSPKLVQELRDEWAASVRQHR